DEASELAGGPRHDDALGLAGAGGARVRGGAAGPGQKKGHRPGDEGLRADGGGASGHGGGLLSGWTIPAARGTSGRRGGGAGPVRFPTASSRTPDRYARGEEDPEDPRQGEGEAHIRLHQPVIVQDAERRRHVGPPVEEAPPRAQ